MKKDQLEIILEDIRGKFDLVLEGHDAIRKEIKETRQELCEKIGLVNFKVEALNQKIGDVESRLTEKIVAIAADLADHRSDTEAHSTIYKVKEDQ